MVKHFTKVEGSWSLVEDLEADPRLLSPAKPEEESNPIDVIALNVPLMLRLLEYAREDVNKDIDLHFVLENAIVLMQQSEFLGMENYDALVSMPDETKEVEPEAPVEKAEEEEAEEEEAEEPKEEPEEEEDEAEEPKDAEEDDEKDESFEYHEDPLLNTLIEGLEEEMEQAKAEMNEAVEDVEELAEDLEWLNEI